MPPPCTRCRQVAPCEGDLWCLACSSWESLGRDLGAHWESTGARAIATDLVVNCVRQVRALRNLGAGLHGAPVAVPEADTRRASEPAGIRRAGGGESGPSTSSRTREHSRRLPAPPAPPPPPKVTKAETDEEAEADLSEEYEEETEEEDETTAKTESLKKGDHHKRPPEPDSSVPRGSTHTDRDRGRASREHRSKRHHSSGHRSDRRSSDHKPKKRRGGRKHQKLYRLADNPSLQVHRKLGAEFLQLASLTQGKAALERFS